MVSWAQHRKNTAQKSATTHPTSFGSSGGGSYRGIPLPSGTKTEGTLNGSSPFVKPKVVVPSVPKKGGGGSSGGGTYYSGSGTYVDSSGQGMSISKEEAKKMGATVSTKSDPQLSQTRLTPSTTTTTDEKRRANLPQTYHVGTGEISADIGGEFKPHRTSWGKAIVGTMAGVFGAIKGERAWKDVNVLPAGKYKEEETAYTTLGFKKSFPFITATETTYGDIVRKEREKATIETPSIAKQVYMTPEQGYISLLEQVSLDVSKKYQEKIDAGKLTLEQAKIEADIEASGLFEEQSKELEKFYKKTTKYGKIKETKSERIIKSAPPILETAGIVGLSLTGPSGIMASSAWMMGRGATTMKKGQDPTLTTGQRIKLTSLGATQMGFGIAGAGMSTKALEHQIVNLELKDLGQKKWSTLTLKKSSLKADKFMTVGERSSGGLKQELLVRGKTFRVGDKGYITPRSEVIIKTSGKLDWNILSGRKGTDFLNVKTYTVKGSGISIPTGKGTSFSFGEVITKPRWEAGTMFTDKTTAKQFIKSFQKSFKDFAEKPSLSVVSGQHLQGTKGITFSRGFNLKSVDIGMKGGKVTDVNIIAPQTSRGFTFDVTGIGSGRGAGAIKVVSGKGAGSSQKYFQNLYGSDVSTSLSKVTPTIKTTTSFIVNVPIFKDTTRMTGITEVNFNKLILKPKTAPLQIPLVIAGITPSIKVKTGTRTKTILGSTTRGLINLKSLQVPKAKVVPALSSGTITLTKQASKLTPAIATIPVGGLDTGFITTPTMGGGLPFAVPLFTLGAPFKFGGVKKFKGKRKFAYTPSYKAFAFGIQSKAKTPISTKKWTGLETRPFTKGFSFFKIRSLLKKKKKGK